jgi:hypothetical protein
MATIWICRLSRTNCVSHILQQVGAKAKSSQWSTNLTLTPWVSTLHRIS